MHAWMCMDRSSRPPKAPPTPPSASRTFSSGSPRLAATWIWSRCSHCAATWRSTPPSPSGMARPDSGPRKAGSWVPTSKSASITTSACSARRGRVPVPDAHVAHQVPPGVDEAVIAAEGGLGVDDRRQLLVLHDDLVERTTGDLRVVGGDDRDGLALVPHLVEGEHRLIGHLHAVGLLAWDVVVGEHGGDAGHGQRAGGVEADDASPRVRAAQRGAPQGPAQVQIGRVGEVAGDLERAVGSGRRVTDTAVLAGAGWRLRAFGLDRAH